MNLPVRTQSHGSSAEGRSAANLSLHATAHGVVDASCTATVLSIFSHGALPVSQAFGYITWYCVAGFGLRPVLGFFVDRWQAPRFAASAGCLLAATAALLFLRAPLVALPLAGLGNALFHVGGGGICFRATPGRAAGPGVFAAPGALGLAVGTFMGMNGRFPAWLFAAGLLLLALAAALLRPPGMNYESQRCKVNTAWFEIAILLVFLSVALGSFIGLAMAFPWKSDLRLLSALTAGIVLGRGLGGMIADRLGWMRTAGCALLAALPLLSIGAQVPGAAIAGIFLFNAGVASAAAAIANLLPGRPAFAFGLVSLGLILGALPAFGDARQYMAAPAVIAGAVLLLAALYCAGLRFYFKEKAEQTAPA